MKSGAEAVVLPAAHARALDYVALAKPRLNFLVVASALAGYAMGGGDMSNPLRLLATVIGTALVACGASAFNQGIEREADGLMRRTRLRPLPDGRLQPRESLVFASVSSAAGLAVLAAGANPLSAGVALATLLTLCNAASRPAFLAYGSELAPRQRGALFGLIALTNQSGLVIGSAVGAAAIGGGGHQGMALAALAQGVLAAGLALPLLRRPRGAAA